MKWKEIIVFGMVNLQKIHLKDAGLSMVFVLLFCFFLGMHIEKYLEEEAIDGQEEQNQKKNKKKGLENIKKDGGLVYKGRKSNHNYLIFKINR